MLVQKSNIDIKNFLPHRPPMLMVDTLQKLTKEKVESIYKILPDNVFVSENYFQEIGLVENAAQTCSSIVGQSFFRDQNRQEKKETDVIGFISGIKKTSIYSLPKVAQTIKTIAVLTSRFDTPTYTICTMQCEIYLQESLIFEAEINLFIQDRSNEEGRSATR